MTLTSIRARRHLGPVRAATNNAHLRDIAIGWQVSDCRYWDQRKGRAAREWQWVAATFGLSAADRVAVCDATEHLGQ